MAELNMVKGRSAVRSSRKSAILDGFKTLWGQLFSSPIHLDSALFKAPPHLKGILAQLVQPLLLRPSSLAEALGIGMAPGEPWSLSKEDLLRWKTATLIAERLHETLSTGHAFLSGVPSVPEDFPPRFIEEWQQEWGDEISSQMIFQLAQVPSLSLRAVRTLGAPKLLDRLSSGSRLPVRAALSDISPMGVKLSGYAPVLQSELFTEGAFEIQDEGSQVMSFFAIWPEIFGVLLQSEPGSIPALNPIRELPALPKLAHGPLTVIDACAGAGGKTLAIADALGGRGRVFAYDPSAKKLQALRRRAIRADLNNIKSLVLESNKEQELTAKFARSAHVVLVDAPCSGWGVLRRNPDIKWRQDSTTLKRMPILQLELLSQYSELVAPGGRLIYGVCTFRKGETVDVVSAFLNKHHEFEPTHGGYLGPGSMDGFFMQAFERRK
jgi:16S rRNA C967 or C1407 C5-methylase (RsmB/RsmF family)